MNKIRFIILLFSALIVWSCKAREVNYIPYYQQVVEIDSIYRMADKPKVAIRKYRRLFRKYEPKNGEFYREYSKYIMLADRYGKNFGGEKSLKKLIRMESFDVYWRHRFKPLLDKYKIDSIEMEKEYWFWRKGLNQELIDSFSLAMKRREIANDLEGIVSMENIKKVDSLNSELLNWTFKKYGYPSRKLIGNFKNDSVFIDLSLLIGYSTYTADYDLSFLKELFQYVRTGDYPVKDYAELIDILRFNENQPTKYGMFFPHSLFEEPLDSNQIDRNRKKIGLPSLKHEVDIYKN